MDDKGRRLLKKFLKGTDRKSILVLVLEVSVRL